MMDTTIIHDEADVRDEVGTLPGSFGRFTVLSRIAQGGMGTVLYAVDFETLEGVAIKTVKAEAPSWVREYLENEGETLAKLRHPGVVRFVEAGFGQGHSYVAMEYVAGDTLAERMAGRRLSFVEVASVLPRLLDALSAVHAAGLVHRDVKPSNVILANDGRVVLVDFGLAGPSGEDCDCLAGFVIGTPLYMAPEQYWLDEPKDARTDLFAFGCLLYECLTGAHPFRGVDPDEIMRRIDAGPPEAPSALRSGVSVSMDALVLSLLARRMQDRPSSADEVRGLLESALADCVDAPRWVDLGRRRAGGLAPRRGRG